jgi:hypothetical protein
VENYLAIVSTLRNVVGDARKGDARAAGHTREKWEAWAKVLRKMRLSPLPPHCRPLPPIAAPHTQQTAPNRLIWQPNSRVSSV